MAALYVSNPKHGWDIVLCPTTMNHRKLQCAFGTFRDLPREEQPAMATHRSCRLQCPLGIPGNVDPKSCVSQGRRCNPDWLFLAQQPLGERPPFRASPFGAGTGNPAPGLADLISLALGRVEFTQCTTQRHTRRINPLEGLVVHHEYTFTVQRTPGQPPEGFHDDLRKGGRWFRGAIV